MPTGLAVAAPQTLRPYQVEAVSAIEHAWEDHQRVLLVMATGLGKTTIFTQIIHDRVMHGRRAMVLVDRIELVDQAVNRVREWGIQPSIEVADSRADRGLYSRSPVVVSTVQTQRSGGNGRKRRDAFDPGDFSTVIVDEAHLSITPGTRATLDHYGRNPHLRILGVTATPDRTDRKSLAQIYQHVAYRYDLRDAIEDGWLVPVEAKRVTLPLDLSDLDDRGGDFDADELAAFLERNEAVYKTLATLTMLPPTESTLVFCARVAHAEILCQALNEHRPGCAAVVSGDTPERIRRHRVESFRRGETQFLCNCAVLTTGFDAPMVRCVAMVRPTRSRMLFAQCVGRGTRPLPGLVDTLDAPEARIAAIAASPKPRLRVLTFVGMGGGVDLVGPEDILAGDMTPPQAVIAAKKAADDGTERDVMDALQDAEREEEAREVRRRLPKIRRAPAARFRDLDLFKRGGARVAGQVWSRTHEALTSRQLDILHKGGFTDRELASYDPARAKRAVDWVIRRWSAGLCSWKQWKLLRSRGIDADRLTRDEATSHINAIAAREGWRRPGGEG